MRTLAQALDRAADGRGCAVVVEGPAGIGKTSLLEHTRDLGKRSGFGRLCGIGDVAERALPWGVVRQLVERSPSRHAGPLSEAIMAGPADRALCALDEASRSDSHDEAAFAQTLHALWWVAVDLSSTRPLLISVDDAQWADVASHRFLVYLARRISDLPVALVVGTRPPQESSGPLVELTAGRLADRLILPPLSREATAELVRRGGSTPAPEVVAAVHLATGGNPFLTGQLLHELSVLDLSREAAATASAVPELAPQTVSRALLAGLSPAAAALAGAAAVLGGRCDLPLAGALAELEPGAAAQAVDELVVGDVLAAAGVVLTFVHPVIREAVLGSLRPGRRMAMHAAAAQRLAARGAPPQQVALHLVYAPAGTLPDGVQILRRAAASLLAAGDAPAAVTQLQRALDEARDDTDLRADLGRALLRAGEPEQARAHLLMAAESPCSPKESAQRRADAARATLSLRGPSVAAAELADVLDAPGCVVDFEARLLLEGRLGAVSGYTATDLKRFGTRLAPYANLPGRTHEERTLLALLAQRGLYGGKPAAQVAALAIRALDGGRYFDAGGDRVPWGNAVHALACADGIEPAAAEVAHARNALRSGGSPVEFSMVCAAASLVAWRVGDVAVAEVEALTGLDSLELADDGTMRIALAAVTTRLGAQAALERGDLAAAAALIAAFDASLPDPPPLIPVHHLRLGRAALALARDDPSTALSQALTLGDTETVAQIDNPAIGWRIFAALAAQRLGEDEQACELAGQQLAAARHWGAGSDLGMALRLMARLDGVARLALLEEAVVHLERSPARLQLASALTDLGEALRVARRRADAREPLRRAADLARACGARLLHARALDGLAALGDRPRLPMFTGTESLTASERRIADLAGAGRTNRDIAQDLFVTPKTVENHLGRVYVKLGISGRRDLAPAMKSLLPPA